MRARVKVSTFLKNGDFIAAGQILEGKMADEAVKSGVAEKIESAQAEESPKKRGRIKK